MAVRDYLIPQLQQGGDLLSQSMLQKKQQERELYNAVMKELITQRLNPMNRILELGKVAEALQNLGIPLQDVISRPNLQQPSFNLQNIQRQPIPMSQPSNIQATEFKQTPFGGIQPTKFEDMSIKSEQIKTQEAAKLSTKQTEEFLKTRQNLARLGGSFSELVANMKLMEKEQGGLGVGPAIKGTFGRLGARLAGETDPTKVFSGISGFEGQLNEMALSLSPILTGQNRVIQGIVAMIQKTLPTRTVTGPEATRLIRQTLTNAFKIQLAVQKSIISPEEIKKLNDQDEATIIKKLDELSRSVTLTKQEQILFEQLWNRIKATPASRPETMFPIKGQSSSYKVIRQVR